jgi:hypothetical protein
MPLEPIGEGLLRDGIGQPGCSNPFALSGYPTLSFMAERICLDKKIQRGSQRALEAPEWRWPPSARRWGGSWARGRPRAKIRPRRPSRS